MSQAGAPGPLARLWASLTRAQAKVLGQLWRYAAIGALAAILDFGTYHGLRALGLDVGILVDLARGASFVVGTTTAYVLNKRYTFHAAGGVKRLSSFVVLWGTVFVGAVGVNRWMLQLLPDSAWQSSIAWFISQAMASMINFVMLKFVVFREADQALESTDEP